MSRAYSWQVISLFVCVTDCLREGGGGRERKRENEYEVIEQVCGCVFF